MRKTACPSGTLAVALAAALLAAWAAPCAAATTAPAGAARAGEAAGTAPASLDFDRVFVAGRAPAAAHFAARYQAGGTTHTLETWRDGERRLLRRTDDALATQVTRDAAGDAEWHMTVLDLKRRIRTDIDRTNLYRIGHFTDWFGLAHGLSRPAGPYTLRAVPALASPTGSAAPPPAQPCRWYALSQEGRESRICWSAKLKLPMLITDAAGAEQWRITRADTRPAKARDLRIDDTGFARNDANEDIRAD